MMQHFTVCVAPQTNNQIREVVFITSQQRLKISNREREKKKKSNIYSQETVNEGFRWPLSVSDKSNTSLFGLEFSTRLLDRHPVVIEVKMSPQR